MPQVITDPATGQSFTVVDEGSNNDPFAANNAASLGAPAAESVVVLEPAASRREPIVQVTTDAQPNLGEELSPEEEAEMEALLNGLISRQVIEERKQWQSAADQRYDGIKKQLDAMLDTNKTLQQKLKDVEIADLDPDEQEALRAKWANDEVESRLKEREETLNDYEAALDEYQKTLYIGVLVQDYGEYGVTPEHLAKYNEPEDMDAFCDTVKTLIERNRGGTDARQSAAAGATARGAQQAVPAGASAASDVGGAAVSAPPAQLDKGTGVDAIAASLSRLPNTTVRIRQ
mgnify:FL=1